MKAALALVALLSLGACAVTNADNPTVTASRSAGDQRAGDSAYPAILRQYGGAYEDRKLRGYIREIGGRLAKVTEQPEGPWTFTVLDTPIINAFATPGGYVYVSRGLIALAEDEAQLASVIGHEMGHVTAAHSIQRDRAAGLARLGAVATSIGAAALGLPRVAVEAIGQIGGVAAQGAVASYSRGQELEADALGVRYMAAAGYDPSAGAEFLSKMRDQKALDAKLEGRGFSGSSVDFFSTHPASDDRIRNANRAAARAGLANAPRHRDRFLNAIDGLVYGDSQGQGRVQGTRFAHAGLGVAFDAPQGWTLKNGRNAVRAFGPRRQLLAFDSIDDPGGDIEAATLRIARAMSDGRGEILTRPQRLTIKGSPAAQMTLRAPTRSGPRDAVLTLIRRGGGKLWRFAGTAGTGDRAGLAAMARASRSLRAAPPGAGDTLRLRIVTARAGDSIESLAARSGLGEAAPARLRVLNGMRPGAQPRPGAKLKLPR